VENEVLLLGPFLITTGSSNPINRPSAMTVRTKTTKPTNRRPMNTLLTSYYSKIYFNSCGLKVNLKKPLQS
jgi:hypothetical protein